MDDNKIKITKELVKQQYKRSFFHKHFFGYLLSLFYISLFAGVLLALMLHNVLNNPLSIIILFIFFPGALLGVWEITASAIEFMRVLHGNFFITTDKISMRQREKLKWYGDLRFMNFPANFRFERYGNFYFGSTFFSTEKKTVAIHKQFNEACLGDTYYVAVLNKNKRIIAVFNSENYYI